MVLADGVDRRADHDGDQPPVAGNEVRQGDDDLGRHRQFGAQSLEQCSEHRDDLPQNDHHHDAGDGDDGHRIDHGRLDLAVQLDRFLDVDGQTLQDGIENTARLAGGDHVGVEVVEDLGVFAH